MNKNSLSIIILAAGKGSRMKSSTAKVLHNISGKPMLYHIIKTSLEISNDISVVVAHQKEKVIEEIEKYFNNIKFITQDTELFPGTGGALKNIEPMYEKVLILNGDIPLIQINSLKQFLSIDSDIIMSIFNLKNPSGYGRVVIKNTEVQEIIEQKDCSDKQLKISTVNAGIYLFKKEILNKYIPMLNNNNVQNEYYLTDIISMVKKDSLSISPILVDENDFKGVNSKKDLSDCENIMQTRIKKILQENGTYMQLPDTIYIEDGVEFFGECIIENSCKITGNCKITNSHIKSGSVIEDSIIENSNIGPLAHIRPNSNIKNSHIGNFVEIKKSNLDGVKAGHLSYLGDAEIKSGTNIGAGVITCNYDGINKYKTKIGENVFIGSDSQLLAPLNIENNVMIAAGTTLASGTIKSGSLAISRTKIKIIPKFFYKFFKNIK